VLECFLYESRGVEPQGERNGYLLGKKWMDVSLSMWREDMPRGMGVFKWELYQDPFFKDHHWWLDKVLKGMPGSKE
jgi:hypothetical protein